MKVLRDSNGVPVQVIIDRFGRKVTVIYNENEGFVFTGQRDTLPDVPELLKLVFPYDKPDVFNIPSPLPVVSVTGGETILFDDFESLLKWRQLAATVAIDNTNAFNGGQSLKISSAAGVLAGGSRYFPISPTKKINLYVIFAIDDLTKLEYLTFNLIHIDDNDTEHTAAIRLNASGQVQYRNSGGTYTNLFVSSLTALNGVGGPYNKLSFGVDFINKKYTEITLNEKTQLIDTVNILSGNSGGNPSSTIIYLTVDALAGQNVNCWFDDVLIKEIK